MKKIPASVASLTLSDHELFCDILFAKRIRERSIRAQLNCVS